MNDYDTRNERGTLETDFDQLPGETSTVGEESTFAPPALVLKPSRSKHANSLPSCTAKSPEPHTAKAADALTDR